MTKYIAEKWVVYAYEVTAKDEEEAKEMIHEEEFDRCIVSHSHSHWKIKKVKEDDEQ